MNSKPLIVALQELVPAAEIALDYPSCLADSLRAGALDIALLPSIECLRHPDYEVISDACVAARGPVLSVKLFSRVPLSDIKRLALDEGSRTSVALVRILLHSRLGIAPKTEALALGQSVDDTQADAILLIGDRSIRQNGDSYHTVWDLGAEWAAWTGLPFVFALWTTRVDCTFPRIADTLCLARDRGIQAIDSIVRVEAARVGLSEAAATDYLTKNLHYHLGADERAGLNRFSKLASELKLVPEGAHFAFRSTTPTG